MNYVLKSSIREKRIGLPSKIAGVLAVLLLIFHLFFPSVLSKVFITILGPLWGTERSIEGESVTEETSNALMLELQSENESLKEILGRKGDRALTLGYILKKPPFSAYDIFILDIGESEGVQKGNPVYALGDILIGEILEVTGDISKAKLYSSYGETFDVFIGEKNLQAEALGRGGGSFEALLPRDSDVKEGDLVTIPTLSNGAFALVTKVLADPARPFATILFSQPLNIYEQKWVQVETGIQRVNLGTTTDEVITTENDEE